MLEVNEKEQLLKEHTSLFTTSQLVAMLLEISSRTNSLATVCERVSLQFRAEGAAMLQRLAANNSGDAESDGLAVSWPELVDRMLVTAADIRPLRKYFLLQLVLDILDTMEPMLSSIQQQVSRLAELISIDLRQKNITRGIFRDLAVCLAKMANIDQTRHGQLVAEVGALFVAVTSQEDCLEIFLVEADQLTPELANMFFAKAVEAFNSQKSSGGGLWNKFLSAVGLGGGKDAKSENLGRLFSHCIRETDICTMDAADAVPVILAQPALANMMKFFPRFLNLDILPTDIVAKAMLILEHVEEFSLDVAEGRLTLQLVLMLRDEQRAERLVSLVTSLEEIRSKTAVSAKDARTFIRLRTEELAEYHRAAEDIRIFAARFGEDFKDFKVHDILAQFERDPADVELRELCKFRSKVGNTVILQLEDVSADQLVQVRRHNQLYRSAVFRIIQDRLLEDRKR